MGNFFNNIAAKFQAFMVGRNGSDKLAFACITAALIVVIINMFVPNMFLTLIVWALLIYYIFRCFSTNVAARQAENEKFESLISRVKAGGAGKGAGAGGKGAGSGGRAGKCSAGRTSYSRRSARHSQARHTGASRAKKPEDDTLMFQCEQCGQKLSVPKGKGTLKITCPKCHHQQKIHS